MKILFAGGGSGGHIYPIVAVAQELKSLSSNLELYYFGDPGPYRRVLEIESIKISKVLSAKLRRYFDVLGNLIDIPKFLISIFQLLWKIFWLMPDVLFSVGGPGALAVVMISWFYRVPIIIHEADSVPGLTTQISSKLAQRISLSFESTKERVKGNVAVVGNPTRRFLLTQDISQTDAKKALGFNPESKPLILFINGSQGATRINDFVLDNYEELIKNFQVLHQTGPKNFKIVQAELTIITKNFAEEEKARYKVAPFFEDDLKTAMIAADVIISRAGSGSIFEIAAFGKPSILIPLPEAAGDHQIKNAYEYANSGATIVMETGNLTTNLFMDQLKKLLMNPEKMKSMSEAAKRFSKPNAARMVAGEILNLGSRG